MTDKNKPRGHEFDGILEYDNDLPAWWVAMFVLTVVFGAGYMVWYHSGLFPAQNLAEHYAEDVESGRLLAAAAVPSPGPAGSPDQAADAGSLDAGKQVFLSTCAPCHGLHGQGVVGPNLTDDFWLNGETIADVERVITKGSLEKGMPAWGEILGPTKVKQLVAYVVSLQGTNPPAAKPAQGNAGKLK